MADRVGALSSYPHGVTFWILALVTFAAGIVLITLALWDHHR